MGGGSRVISRTPSGRTIEAYIDLVDRPEGWRGVFVCPEEASEDSELIRGLRPPRPTED
jgi:hypothetical protein